MNALSGRRFITFAAAAARFHLTGEWRRESPFDETGGRCGRSSSSRAAEEGRREEDERARLVPLTAFEHAFRNVKICTNKSVQNLKLSFIF